MKRSDKEKGGKIVEKTFFARIFFKKTLPFILVCILIIGLCACGNDENGGISDDSAGDSVADTSDNTDNSGSDNTDNSGEVLDGEQPEAQTFFLNSPALDIRLLGERENRDGVTVSCNYPGSGFEGKLKSNGGAVTVKLKADGECSFLVYVDGELRKNSEGKDFFTAAEGLLEIGELAEGEHTLRVIRASGYGVEAELYAITFSGEMGESGNVGDRTFIEFIGDGINSKVGGASFTENVGNTYSYLIADQMNADYSITSYNSNGLVSTRVTVADLYGTEGDYTRAADIAVINVGELDVLAAENETIDMSQFRSKYEALAKKVKELNGAECKVLMICTSGGDSFKDAVSAVCDSLGGANSGYFFKALSASEGVLHTEAEHEAYAEEIMEAIEEFKDFTIQPIRAEQSGTGSSVSLDSAKWGTL